MKTCEVYLRDNLIYVFPQSRTLSGAENFFESHNGQSEEPK
jgi:hypothetical protein